MVAAHETPNPTPRNRTRTTALRGRSAQTRHDDSSHRPGLESEREAGEEVPVSAGGSESPALPSEQAPSLASETYQVGDTIVYTNTPDRPMQILEIIDDRFKVKRLHDEAEFYVYRSLVVRDTQKIATPQAELQSEPENCKSHSTPQLLIPHLEAVLKDTGWDWSEVLPDAQPLLIKFLGCRTEAKAIDRLILMGAVNECLPWAMRERYHREQQGWVDRKMQHPSRRYKTLTGKQAEGPDDATAGLLDFYRQVWGRFETWKRKQPNAEPPVNDEDVKAQLEQIADHIDQTLIDDVQDEATLTLDAIQIGSTLRLTTDIKQAKAGTIATVLSIHPQFHFPIEVQFGKATAFVGLDQVELVSQADETPIEPEQTQTPESILLPALPSPHEIATAIVPNHSPKTIDALLSHVGFYPIAEHDFYPDGEPEPYRGWQIVTESHEGALMAIDISDGEQWLSLPNEADDWFFGYRGHQQAIEWAKQFIDCLVEAAEEASGQLNLLEPVNATDNTQLDIIGNQGESITSGSPLDTLITEINTLYGQLEEAEQVAVSAAHSALEFARDMGDKLLQAKKVAGHGNWEKVREQILSPRTEKPIPSSTATLYVRIFERWEELDAGAIATIREASDALKKPRLKSATVAEMQPIVHEKSLVDSLEGLQANFYQRQAEADIAEKYHLVEDVTVPPMEDLITLYQPIGDIRPTRDGKGFAVLRPDLGNPFPLLFRSRVAAWDYWLKHKDRLQELAERKPKPAETDDREVVPVDRISRVNQSNGWIHTTDGQNLNPQYYKPEVLEGETLTDLSNTVKTIDSVNQSSSLCPDLHLLGFSEIHYAVRKFVALNELDWDEAKVDEAAAKLFDFLAEY